VSDSLLAAISPYFKFPEWTQGKNTVLSNEKEKKNNQHTIKDLNQITGEELESINGIGKKLSARIIKFRNRLGGFLVDEQLYDVYGLDEEVAGKALQKFKVLKPPLIEKIAINSASASEISQLVYIPYRLAEKIVKKRELVGHYESVEDLLDIPSFPVDRKDRIALYLSF
jgi:DNA uptake protein ComE-like DNA-binding protein